MPPAGATYAPCAALRPFLSPGGAVALSPDGALVLAAHGADASLVDAATGALLATLPGDTEPVTALCFRRGSSERSPPHAGRRPHRSLSRSLSHTQLSTQHLPLSQRRRVHRVHRVPLDALLRVGGCGCAGRRCRPSRSRSRRSRRRRRRGRPGLRRRLRARRRPAARRGAVLAGALAARARSRLRPLRPPPRAFPTLRVTRIRAQTTPHERPLFRF